MMRSLVAAVFLFVAPLANAIEATELVAKFATTSSFARSQAAYDFCDESFAASADVYIGRIRTMGQLWRQAPEAAYHALSTCQTIWVSKYLDPVRLAQLQKRDRSVVAFLLSGADLLYSHLPEEIRLTLQTLPRDPRLPLSPYEILSDLASTERSMNETLNREMRSAAATLLAGTATVGLTARTLKGIKSLATVTAGASQTAGKLVKQSLLVALVAVGVGAAADNGLWHLRKNQLQAQVDLWAARILQPNGTPLSVLLDEYYRALEKLGFFYTYDLYLAESGQASGENSVNANCASLVHDYFTSGKPVEHCQDAATLWIRGARFLHLNLPGNREAAALAERLKAKAKRAFWRYLEVEEYIKSLPVCRPVPSPTVIFKIEYECTFDGKIII